jgi:hypothetical protein
LLLLFLVWPLLGVKFLCRMAFLGYNLHIIVFTYLYKYYKNNHPQNKELTILSCFLFFYLYNIIKSRMFRFPNLGCGLVTLPFLSMYAPHTELGYKIVRDVTQLFYITSNNWTNNFNRNIYNIELFWSFLL